MALNNTLNLMDLIGILRAFCPEAIEYMFFLSGRATFSGIYHMLGHRNGLSKFKKIDIISRIFPDNNCVKLEVNKKKWYTGGLLQSCTHLKPLSHSKFINKEIKATKSKK